MKKKDKNQFRITINYRAEADMFSHYRTTVDLANLDQNGMATFHNLHSGNFWFCWMAKKWGKGKCRGYSRSQRKKEKATVKTITYEA